MRVADEWFDEIHSFNMIAVHCKEKENEKKKGKNIHGIILQALYKNDVKCQLH